MIIKGIKETNTDTLLISVLVSITIRRLHKVKKKFVSTCGDKILCELTSSFSKKTCNL